MSGDKERLIAVLAVLTCCIPRADLFAQVQFVDVSSQSGIGAYLPAVGIATGAAAADFDDDGDIDLFVPNGRGALSQLYRNRGDGNFDEVGQALGLTVDENDRAGLWFDFDGDGDLDLAVANDRYRIFGEFPADSTLRLYRQEGDGTFVDVTDGSGLAGVRTVGHVSHIGSLTAGDVNNDGWLDLYLGAWAGKNYLFLNETNGTFKDVSLSAGIQSPGLLGHWQTVIHDFDGDGWQDLFSAIDFDPNHLWLNKRDGTFIDIAPMSGVDSAWNEMGVTVGDYDNDGDLDLYVTNIAREERHSILLRNDSVPGNVLFTEVSKDAGVDNGYWGWGTTFLDCNHDGLLDLVATNGYDSSAEPWWRTDPSRCFINAGTSPPTFIEASDQVGFNDTYQGSCLLSADIDRDGDLDLVQSVSLAGQPLRLLACQQGPPASAAGYLVVKPRMDGPNGRSIGAVVRVTAGDLQMMRLITAGMSIMGQEPAEAHFGLAGAPKIDVLRVEFPDGRVTTLRDVQPNQVITVSPGCIADVSGDGLTGMDDLNKVIAEFNSTGSTADANGDGFVDMRDLNLVLGNWGRGCI